MPSPLLLRIATLIGVSVAAVAQCANGWAVNVSLPTPGFVYDSTMWDPDGTGPTVPRLVACGPFPGPGPTRSGRVMAFDDATGVWQAVGAWNAEHATALAAGPNGDLFAALLPTTALQSFRVMHWNGVAWAQLGGTFDGQIMSAKVVANGDLVVGGGFSSVGPVSAANVARWDGSSWQPMGNGVSDYCDELLVMPDGDVVAGGMFGVARWNGVAWTQLGTFPSGWCLSLARLPDNEIVAGGVGAVARWNGASWIPLGGVVLPNAPYIESLAVLPNGDVLAAEGTLVASGTFPRIARWNGATWTPIATTDGAVRRLTVRPGPSLDVVAAGNFMSINGAATIHVARLTTTCPAAVTAIASGCVVSGTSLTAEPPWVGSVWRATASGLPQTAVVLGMYGFAPVVTPLSSVIPQAVAGCTLQSQCDALQFLPTTNGVASTSWRIPNLVALAGAQFRHQMIVLQFGTGLAISSATTTGAAQLTIGAF